jgi:hypothetical protein
VNYNHIQGLPGERKIAVTTRSHTPSLPEELLAIKTGCTCWQNKTIDLSIKIQVQVSHLKMPFQEVRKHLS